MDWADTAAMQGVLDKTVCYWSSLEETYLPQRARSVSKELTKQLQFAQPGHFWRSRVSYCEVHMFLHLLLHVGYQSFSCFLNSVLHTSLTEYCLAWVLPGLTPWEAIASGLLECPPPMPVSQLGSSRSCSPTLRNLQETSTKCQ